MESEGGRLLRLLYGLLPGRTNASGVDDLQCNGKSDGISGAFTGNGGLNLFANVKERGSEKVISNATMVLGVLFFVLVILIRVVD